MSLYGFLYDFWRFDLNFRMTRFSEFERWTGNSNVRLEIPTTTEMFGWPVFLNFERSTGNSNVQPEIPTTTEIFGWPVFLNFERSTGNSNVRPEIPTTTEIFQWPVFFTINVWPDFERSTGNSKYHRNFRMTRFFEFWRFDRKFEVPPKFSDYLFFWILNVRPLRSHFQKSHKNHIKSYKNHIKIYEKPIKTYEKPLKTFTIRWQD